MSDTNSSIHIDIEAQHAPLLGPDNPSRQVLYRIILALRSSERFIAAANINERSPVLSRVSSTKSASTYTVISSCDAKDEDSEIAAAAANSLLSSPEDYFSVPSLFENQDGGIDLQSDQSCQRSNIAKIVREENLKSLRNIGGVEGVAKALDTDLKNGISGDSDEIWRRKTSTLPQTQAAKLGFFHFLLEACNNYPIGLLSVAAVLALGLGIKKEGRKNGWFDGAIIILTIIVLVIFPSIRNYWHESRNWKKSKKQELAKQSQTEVIRGGSPDMVPISDLVYGDIVLLKMGYQVPADGLFVAGQPLKLDDGLVFIINKQKPFLFDGARVIEGNASMIVTSVGDSMSEAANSSDQKTKLEEFLDKLNTCIPITGIIIAILIVLVSFFKLGKTDDENGYRPESKGEPTSISMFINVMKRTIVEPKGTARVLTTLLSVSLVGVMEGIPFVVCIAIIYWNKKTLSDWATERDLLGCVKMASVTRICTDKFGGLKEHAMEVDKFYVGEEVIDESSVINRDVLELLCEGIGTSVVMPQSSSSSMYKLLLFWAKEKLGLKNENLEPSCMDVRHRNTDEESYGVLIEKNGDSGRHMYHWNGPAKSILAMCSHYYDGKGQIHTIDDQKRMLFQKGHNDMLGQHLKLVAFACKPKGPDVPTVEANDLTLLGLVALKDTSREDTRNAITSIAGGVKTILISGDDVSVLETIAQDCGLLPLPPYSIADQVLKGEEFRALNDQERMEKVDRICVLGNSLPSDKVLLVKSLRQKGEVVAMVGQRTTDAPALKEADIGLAMGTRCSEKARESSNIIILDENFDFLIKMIRSGKCVYGNIQKFVQLELVTAIASSLTNFITIVVFSGDAPLTTIQLFWVNLLVNFLGGMALLTEPPAEKLRNMPPVTAADPLITKAMMRNIVVQAAYQITIFVTLQLKGHAILGISQKASRSMISKSFALCQIFNYFIARELEEKNIFKRVLQNRWFWMGLGVSIVLQAAFSVVEHYILGTAMLNWELWAACFLIGVVSWLIDWAGKFASRFIKIDLFIGWMINGVGNCTTVLIRRYWLSGRAHQHTESISMTLSAPTTSVSNLHRPLMSEESNAIPPQV